MNFIGIEIVNFIGSKKEMTTTKPLKVVCPDVSCMKVHLISPLLVTEHGSWECKCGQNIMKVAYEMMTDLKKFNTCLDELDRKCLIQKGEFLPKTLTEMYELFVKYLTVSVVK